MVAEESQRSTSEDSRSLCGWESRTADETRSLCGWEPDEDSVSRVSVYATLPRKDKWGSLRSLFARKSQASLDLTEEDLEQPEPKAKPKRRFGFKRWRSTASIASCPDTISIGSIDSLASTDSTTSISSSASTASTASKKLKAYRRAKNSAMARPLGVWQEEEDVIDEDREPRRERSLKDNKWIPKEDNSLRIKAEKRSVFGSRTSLGSVFSRKEQEEEPVRPLVLPTGDDRKVETSRSSQRSRYRTLASEDNVLKPRNKPTVDTSYQNGSAFSRSISHSGSGSERYSGNTRGLSASEEVESSLKSSKFSKYAFGRKKAVSNEVYLTKLRDIINAYPTKGPPYMPSMLCFHMYMGSQKNADDIPMLRRLGITHVLNMAGRTHGNDRTNPYTAVSGVTHYLMIPALDFEDYDIRKDFPQALEFLEHARQSRGRALVHCNMGVNRSGAICAAHLISSQKMTLLQAVKLLKVKRNFVLVNPGFQKQLVKYARDLSMLDPI